MGAFYTLEATLQNATEKQTALALSKVRLFKSSLTPTPSTTKADLVAAECDYDGYTAGGEAITAFLDPLLDPAGGASITAPTVQFAWSHVATDVGNLVGGAWLEDAAGKVRLVMPFAEDVPMEGPAQGFPLNLKIGEPTGQAI